MKKEITGKTGTWEIEIVDVNDTDYSWDATNKKTGEIVESEESFPTIEESMENAEKTFGPKPVGRPCVGKKPKSKIHVAVDADLADLARSHGNMSEFVNKALKMYSRQCRKQKSRKGSV